MKRIMRVMSLTLIAIVICVAAMADTMPTVGVQGAFLGEGSSLQVVIHSTVKEADDPAACRVELDQQRVAIESVQDYWKTELGTSWLFLTDTATVATNDGIEPVTALLKGLINNMEENDNAAVISTGKTFSDIKLTDDKGELLEDVKEMRMDSSVKTLYATISDAVAYLNMQADVRPHASLVIISNGETDSEEGMTISELQKIVEDANITVYTVAFSSTSSAALNDYTSLARSGCGGMSIKMPANAKADDIISQIKANERQFRLMTTAPLEASGEQLKVYVSYNDKYMEDSIKLNVKLQEAIATAIAAVSTTEPTVSPMDEPTPAPGSDPEFEIDWMLVIIGGACAVLLIIIVILLVSGRKKKAAANEGDDTPIPDTPAVVVDETEIDENPRVPVTMVTLMQVGGAGNVCFKGELKESLVVGRAGGKAELNINLDDIKISREHFVLRSVAGMVIIENVGKNGTRVNNMEIHQAVELHQQDIIGIGNTNFKISWVRY